MEGETHMLAAMFWTKVREGGFSKPEYRDLTYF